MRVVIAGAGAVGRSVAQELVANGHTILLIERDRRKYEPRTVPEADWFLADACELTSMAQAGIETCDVLIAATGDDKVNLAVSLLAKSEFGVTRVVARVNEARNEELFSKAWGVDVAVATPRAMVASVEGAIDVGHLVRLMGLRQGRAALTTITLESGSPLIGLAPGDLRLPQDCALIVVKRADQVLLPAALDALRGGDGLVFVSASGMEERIWDLVHSSAEPR